MRKKIIESLFPKVRTKILSLTLLSCKKWWYLSDLAKHLGVRVSSLQRELAALTESEILISRKDGNRVYYKANIKCPIFDELQGIFVKTHGIKDVLETHLLNQRKKISFAFIYGSIARGEEISSSDVDLMIIGELTLSDLSKKIRKAEEVLQREVNPTIYSEKEFRKQLGKNHFINEVIKGEKIFIIGINDEFENFIGQG